MHDYYRSECISCVFAIFGQQLSEVLATVCTGLDLPFAGAARHSSNPAPLGRKLSSPLKASAPLGHLLFAFLLISKVFKASAPLGHLLLLVFPLLSAIPRKSTLVFDPKYQMTPDITCLSLWPAGLCTGNLSKIKPPPKPLQKRCKNNHLLYFALVKNKATCTNSAKPWESLQRSIILHICQ